jgi:glycosyltransferase involved in cell wall biosynthesis
VTAISQNDPATFGRRCDSGNLVKPNEHMTPHFFVPRWMNRTSTNAQNANAQALLSRFRNGGARWTTVYSEYPQTGVTENGIETIQLSRSRLWKYQLALAYQSRFDAIFYPGVHWSDEFGIKWRRLTGRPTRVIATIEGLIASRSSVAQLSELAGHPVFSQPGTDPGIPRIRWMYETAEHIIAISPFLARVAEFLYGKKVFYLPLGVDRRIFHHSGRSEPARCRVAGCGTVKSSKNPQMFLELATLYKEADFVWYGDGPMVGQLMTETNKRNLKNLRFAGSLPPEALAQEFRNSSIFVLPSHAEGVPKVTHEAAACGLPIVLNGFYESPTVIHQRNGLVAWSDEELCQYVGVLIRQPERRKKMGEQGVEMAKNWEWDRIAVQWEELLIRLANS